MRRCCSGLVLHALLGAAALATPLQSFGEGSVIPAAVTVGNASRDQESLLGLFAAQPGNVNVLFIFGGGDLGSGMPGHLCCEDSFEDTHIL
jgi:regulator of RNase E activity RraA